MSKFAKLFEIDGTQVLVLKGYNDDEDLPQVEFIADFESGRIQINSGYSSEEKRDEAFEIIDEISAKSFLARAQQANKQFFRS